MLDHDVSKTDSWINQQDLQNPLDSNFDDTGNHIHRHQAQNNEFDAKMKNQIVNQMVSMTDKEIIDQHFKNVPD